MGHACVDLAHALVPEAAVLGDNAYQGTMRTITPYAQYHINAMTLLQRAQASTFNGCHSRRRINSEHISFLAPPRRHESGEYDSFSSLQCLAQMWNQHSLT